MNQMARRQETPKYSFSKFGKLVGIWCNFCCLRPGLNWTVVTKLLGRLQNG